MSTGTYIFENDIFSKTFLIDALRYFKIPGHTMVFTIHIYNVDNVRYVEKIIGTYFDINRSVNYQNTEFTFLIKLNVKIQNSNQ